MTNVTEFDFKNLTKMQQDCLSLIESLGIYELRALARVFGDSSPTILKRSDHINIIMSKIISGEELRAIPLRPGRPYKELSNIEGILAELSQITGKDYTMKTNQPRSASRTQKTVTFKQFEQEVFSQKLNRIEVCGVLLKKSDKEFFLIDQDSKKIVLVKKEFNDELSSYDYITGSAVLMNTEKEYILESVETINFMKYEAYHAAISPYEKMPSYITLPYKGKNLSLGLRYLIKNNKSGDSLSEIKEIVKTFNDEKIITLGLFPNIMHEDISTIQSLGFSNVFITEYDERPLEVCETFSTFINHVTRLQQQGLSVMLFVQDLITFADAIDFSYKNNTKAFMGHTEVTVSEIKKLIMLAKSGAENKHTTLFTTFDEADLTDQAFVTSVFKVSKCL